jgi:hypothetical protein
MLTVCCAFASMCFCVRQLSCMSPDGGGCMHAAVLCCHIWDVLCRLCARLTCDCMHMSGQSAVFAAAGSCAVVHRKRDSVCHHSGTLIVLGPSAQHCTINAAFSPIYSGCSYYVTISYYVTSQMAIQFGYVFVLYLAVVLCLAVLRFDAAWRACFAVYPKNPVHAAAVIKLCHAMYHAQYPARMCSGCTNDCVLY